MEDARELSRGARGKVRYYSYETDGTIQYGTMLLLPGRRYRYSTIWCCSYQLDGTMQYGTVLLSGST